MRDDREKETAFRACKQNLFMQVVSIKNDNNKKRTIRKEKKTVNLTLTTVHFVSKIPK